ncbi:MAG TPA: glycosyltransferase family 4 protein [bacterium]
MSLRIIQVSHDLNIGGLQRVVVNLAKAFRERGCNVSVLVLRERGPLAEELNRSGVDVLTLPGGRRVDYLSLMKISRIIKEQKPHVVHTHNTQPFIEGGLAALICRVPVIVHTDHARCYPDKRRYMLMERLLSRHVNRIVAVSDHTRDDLIRYCGISGKNIRVIHNGIDGTWSSGPVGRLQKLNELGLRPTDGPLIGLGVRLCSQKGVGYLIKAMQLVVKEFPKATLLIAGDGELRSQLDCEAKQLDLDENVHFVGPRLDMPEILRILDIYVLPSLWEGLPLVLLEAMAAALPVVATDVGGNREVVRDGRNGFLVQPCDSPALAKALLNLIADADMRASFGEQSREIFESEFALPRMVENYEKLYLECLGRR